jgi:hypothetical protein
MMRVEKVKVLDPETSVILWDDGSMSVSNIKRGSIYLNQEQVDKFAKICEEVLRDEVDTNLALHE